MDVSLAETQISRRGHREGKGEKGRRKKTAAALGKDKWQQCRRETDKRILLLCRKVIVKDDFTAKANICC